MFYTVWQINPCCKLQHWSWSNALQLAFHCSKASTVNKRSDVTTLSWAFVQGGWDLCRYTHEPDCISSYVLIFDIVVKNILLFMVNFAKVFHCSLPLNLKKPSSTVWWLVHPAVMLFSVKYDTYSTSCPHIYIFRSKPKCIDVIGLPQA